MNPSLILIAVSLFIWGMGESMFYIFLPIHLGQLGAPPVAIGSILGGNGVMMMISHIPAGHLADRWGRRPLLLAGWMLSTIATLIMALASALPLFVVGFLLYGFCAFIMSPLNSYVTAARGSWSISRALSLTTVSFALGSIIGPWTGGWIGDHYGLRTVFAVSTAIFIVSTVVLSFIRPQPRDHHDPKAPPLGLRSNYRYLGFLGIIFIVIFALYLPQQFTPNFLQEVRGLNLSQIGLLGTLGVMGNALVTLAFGAWLSPRAGTLLGQVLVASFALLIWRATGLPVYALAYLLLGGFRAARPMMAAQARELVHPSQMGLAYGMIETVASLALTLAPLSAGLLYHRAPDLMYPVSLGLMALSFTLTLWFDPHRRGEHA